MSDLHVFAPINCATVEWDQGVPVAPQFQDSYFSRDDGMAESQHVFVDGNDLTNRFAALPPGASFTVAETGFGTGLNLMLASRAFLASAPEDTTLHLVSVEKSPLSPQALAASHRPWPALAELSAEFRRHYPPLSPGVHRRWLCGRRISLTLAFGDAADMLAMMPFSADAWFLDGFAPDRNPDMWQDRLYQQITRHSHSGATLATFTAAGHVRRGLADAGFTVARVPGFGRKRHMTTARLDAAAMAAASAGSATIGVAGAGLAGATCARALAQRGHRVLVFDPSPPASGASGNHAGILYTSPSAHPTAQNRFYQASYLQALHWLSSYGFPAAAEDGALGGVEQYPADDRHRRKAIDALNGGLWDPSTLSGDADSGILFFPGGGHLSPPRWCHHLLAHPRIQLIRTAVMAFEEQADVVQLRDSSGNEHNVAHLIVANAAAAASLVTLPTALRQIRGQVTHVRATGKSTTMTRAMCHAGYVSPAIDGIHCVGATFNLRDSNPEATDADNAANLALLSEHLPEVWQALGGEAAEICGQRVGFRCQSNDYLPLAGRLDDAGERIWLSVAHGSRGLASTALCAEIIASAICQEPAPADSGILAALDPMRFAHRQHRKRRPR